MRGEDDCVNIWRTRLDVFSLDENVTTPEDSRKQRASVIDSLWREPDAGIRGEKWEDGDVPVIPM
jgi:hypothetical protein